MISATTGEQPTQVGLSILNYEIQITNYTLKRSSRCNELICSVFSIQNSELDQRPVKENAG